MVFVITDLTIYIGASFARRLYPLMVFVLACLPPYGKHYRLNLIVAANNVFALRRV